MILTFEQIKSVTLGAIAVTEGANGVEFHRFTPEQQQMYIKKRVDFGEKSFASSGIKLCFKTDSRSLAIKVLLENIGARDFCALEVFVNGQRVGYLNNFCEVELPQYYSEVALPAGEFENSFDLGTGEKTVTVYLPWNMRTFLRELVLDDGAYIKPVRPGKKLLAFGDSITQGYEALWPSRRYAGRIADALDAEEINKAIGGERFCPDLAELRDDFTPDYILVAYGTNNWAADTKAVFDAHMPGFFRNLHKNYPTVKTFVLTPVWRKNYLDKTDFESFFDVEKCIRAEVADKENMTVISGFDLIPHDETLYGDQVLHPNDRGFDYYYENLLREIKKYI